jgi:hypothetical protein
MRTFSPSHRQGVEEQQPSADRFADTRDKLQRFGRLRCADDADERREHAHRRAARFLQFLAFAEKAVVARARRIARVEHGDLTVETDRRAGDQWLARGNACPVHRMTGREIVAAVENDIGRARREPVARSGRHARRSSRSAPQG